MTEDELGYLALNALHLDPFKNQEMCRSLGPPAAFVTDAQAWREARDDEAEAQRRGISIVTGAAAALDAMLPDLREPAPGSVPPVLYLEGDARAIELPTVALVGSRRASAYGLEVARHLGSELGRRGIAVVSGLARGIDTAAHRGTLEAGGVTVAVLGSGLARCYPKENGRLLRDIVATGLVMSEFPLFTPPLARNFPRRNRIIAALSDVVVVVEAAHGSGSRHTADSASSQAKTVMAVPGPMTSPTSAGCNALLRDGAQVVTGVEDVLQALLTSRRWVGRKEIMKHVAAEPPPAQAPAPASPLLSLLSVESPKHVEAIASESCRQLPDVMAELQELVMAGAVQQHPGQLFQLRIAGHGNRGS
ncbi:MAG: DNA-processing protein DprA [Acidobacteriota bacterium]